MRPLLSVIVASTILGGMRLYMDMRSQMQPAPRIDLERSTKGVFSLELTLTFDAEPDAFAVEPMAVQVRFRGRDLLTRTEPVAAGEPIVIEPIDGVVQGENEFHVKATPRDDGVARARAVRVRALIDGQLIAETTLWSEPGQPAEGRVMVNVPTIDDSPTDQHNH